MLRALGNPKNRKVQADTDKMREILKAKGVVFKEKSHTVRGKQGIAYGGKSAHANEAILGWSAND